MAYFARAAHTRTPLRRTHHALHTHHHTRTFSPTTLHHTTGSITPTAQAGTNVRRGTPPHAAPAFRAHLCAHRGTHSPTFHLPRVEGVVWADYAPLLRTQTYTRTGTVQRCAAHFTALAALRTRTHHTPMAATTPPHLPHGCPLPPTCQHKRALPVVRGAAATRCLLRACNNTRARPPHPTNAHLACTHRRRRTSMGGAFLGTRGAGSLPSTCSCA